MLVEGAYPRLSSGNESSQIYPDLTLLLSPFPRLHRVFVTPMNVVISFDDSHNRQDAPQPEMRGTIIMSLGEITGKGKQPLVNVGEVIGRSYSPTLDCFNTLYFRYPALEITLDAPLDRHGRHGAASTCALQLHPNNSILHFDEAYVPTISLKPRPNLFKNLFNPFFNRLSHHCSRRGRLLTHNKSLAFPTIE